MSVRLLQALGGIVGALLVIAVTYVFLGNVAAGWMLQAALVGMGVFVFFARQHRSSRENRERRRRG